MYIYMCVCVCVCVCVYETVRTCNNVLHHFYAPLTTLLLLLRNLLSLSFV
jgi:hypothetical protein